MKDLAEATKRVSEKKKELDDLNRQEKKIEELQSVLKRLDADQEVADSAVRFININFHLYMDVNKDPSLGFEVGMLAAIWLSYGLTQL